MEGGSFSKFGSRFSAAHIRRKSVQQLQGWRAVPFQNAALAFAPRTFVLNVSNSYRDGGRFLFKSWLSFFAPRAFVSKVSKTVKGMEGGSFSKRGSRLSPAHIRAHVKRMFAESYEKILQSPRAREQVKSMPNTRVLQAFQHKPHLKPIGVSIQHVADVLPARFFDIIRKQFDFNVCV